MTSFDRRHLLAALLATAPGCARRSDQSRGARLKVSVPPQPSLAAFYCAYEAGYFHQAGFDIDLVEMRTRQVVPLLAGGGIDVAFLSINSSLLNAVARGAPLRIVAGREVAVPCTTLGVVYGRPESFPNGLADLRVLRGKRLVVGRGDGISGFALDMHLDRVGLTRDDLQITEMALPESAAALQTGHADAGLMVNETYTEAGRFVDRLIHSPGLGDILPGFQVSFVIFGRALLDQDPQVGGQFLGCLLRGTRAYLSGCSPKFLAGLARRNGVDPSGLEGPCVDSITPDGAINLDSLSRYQNWAVRRGFLSAVLPPEALVDQRFLVIARRFGRTSASIPVQFRDQV